MNKSIYLSYNIPYQRIKSFLLDVILPILWNKQ